MGRMNTNTLSGARMLVTMHGHQTGTYRVQVTKTKVPALFGCSKTRRSFWVSLLVEVNHLTIHLRFGACVLLTGHSEAKSSCSIYRNNSGTPERISQLLVSPVWVGQMKMRRRSDAVTCLLFSVS